MSLLSDKDITFLSGVGPKKAALLKTEIGVTNYEEMLYYFPYRYIDRSKFYKITEIVSSTSYVQVRGRILKIAMQK